MRQEHPLAGVRFLRSILLLPILVVLLTTSSSFPAFTGLTASSESSASSASSGSSASLDSPDSSADAEAKEAFALAVLRRDSILIPFATYDGKKWKNAWPQPESRVTAPIMLSDVPKRWWSGLGPVAKWTFWPIDASEGAPRTLETIAPTWYPAHCQQGLGLRTTYSTREVMPPPHVQPYPKAGLAVSSGPSAPAIAPIEIVDIASSPLVTPLARTLVAEVAEEENRIINNYVRAGGGWLHPYKEDERKDTPLRIDALYKVARGLGDRDVFYFEGLKHYAIRDPEPSSSKKSSQPNEARTAPTMSQNLRSTPKAPEAKGSQLLQSAEPGKTGDATGTTGTTGTTGAIVATAASGAAGTAAPDAATAQKGGGPGQEPCDLVTFVSGWLIGREDELLKDLERIKPKQVKVVVTSCDFAAASIMLPLGVVRVKDKSLWAVQWSGWTHEHYSLIEVRDDDSMLAAIGTHGGQCPRRQ